MKRSLSGLAVLGLSVAVVVVSVVSVVPVIVSRRLTDRKRNTRTHINLGYNFYLYDGMLPRDVLGLEQRRKTRRHRADSDWMEYRVCEYMLYCVPEMTHSFARLIINYCP